MENFQYENGPQVEKGWEPQYYILSFHSVLPVFV